MVLTDEYGRIYPKCNNRCHCGMGYGCCILCKDEYHDKENKIIYSACRDIMELGKCKYGHTGFINEPEDS